LASSGDFLLVEFSCCHPDALGVLGHAFVAHFVGGEAAAAVGALSCSVVAYAVHVSGCGAVEALVAGDAVLGAVSVGASAGVAGV
jgi:hypothetical protein